MAFDFLSYITQQVEQQHPNLFSDQNKTTRQVLFAHLISLHIIKLRNLLTEDLEHGFAQLINEDTQNLSQLVQNHIHQEEHAKQFFQAYTCSFASSNDKIASTLCAELRQLEQTAHLGSQGLFELIDGQLPWIQKQVENWFWDSTNLPEYKSEIPDESTEIELEQSLHQFNALLHQSADNTISSILVEQTEVAEVHSFYRLINPLLALLIIIFIFLQLRG